MKAVILAAGEGKRLRPLSLQYPKCLIPIAGKPILQYQWDALKANGIEELFVVGGHLIEQIHAYVGNQIQVIFNEDYRTTNILASFALALEAIPEDDDLIVIAGDVVFDYQVIQKLLQTKTKGLSLCVDRKTCGEEEVKVIIEGSQVKELGKQLSPAKAMGEFLGVFHITPSAMPVLRNIVEKMMREEGVGLWLFNMINQYIQSNPQGVSICDVGDVLWEEVDYAADIERITQALEKKANAF